MIKITQENLHRLTGVRSLIDPAFNHAAVKKAEMLKYTTSTDRAAFIYEEANNCLGYVEIILTEELPQGAPRLEKLRAYGHIVRIGVISTARHRGIGAKLLAHAEEWLKSQGKCGAWLDYLVKNHAAAALYKKLRYKVMATFTCSKKSQIRKIAAKRLVIKAPAEQAIKAPAKQAV